MRTLDLVVDPALPPICTTINELNAAFFGRNSSTLTDEARSALMENLDILSQCTNLAVVIEGFAAPGERNSSSLSDDRARAVSAFYRNNGIVAGRISTRAVGEPSGTTTKRGGDRQYRRADSIPQR
jgi:outer membrane protein OmpA-like peptidoglycan-associated protein